MRLAVFLFHYFTSILAPLCGKCNHAADVKLRVAKIIYFQVEVFCSSGSLSVCHIEIDAYCNSAAACTFFCVHWGFGCSSGIQLHERIARNLNSCSQSFGLMRAADARAVDVVKSSEIYEKHVIIPSTSAVHQLELIDDTRYNVTAEVCCLI